MSLGCSRIMDAESLVLLQTVFDDCMHKLEGVWGRDASRSTARRGLVAKRIMDLAQRGILDPEQLEEEALTGLLPKIGIDAAVRFGGARVRAALNDRPQNPQMTTREIE